MNNNNLLETDHLYISKIDMLNDITNIQDYYNDKKTMQWIPNRKDYYSADYLSLKFETNKRSYENGIGIYKLVHKDEEQIIGELGLYNFEEIDNAIEIGYIIISSHWRKGLATELLIKLEDYIQHTIQKKFIIAHIVKGNIASEKLLQKQGYKKTEEIKLSNELSRIQYIKTLTD